ncbi:MAG: hypothetical protein V2A73_08510 [Pseudomonadota bacterium]
MTHKLRSSPLVGLSFAALCSLGATGCIIHDTSPRIHGNGYVYASGSVAIGSPGYVQVTSLPPDPIYEEVTPTPYSGWVWIGGYWHWSGYEWVWMPGHWEASRVGYIFVEPYYHHHDGFGYVYVPGYWEHRTRVPSTVVIRHDSRHRPPTGRYQPGSVTVSRGRSMVGGNRGAPPPAGRGSATTEGRRHQAPADSRGSSGNGSGGSGNSGSSGGGNDRGGWSQGSGPELRPAPGQSRRGDQRDNQNDSQRENQYEKSTGREQVVVPAQPVDGRGRVPVQPVDGHDQVVVPSRPASGGSTIGGGVVGGSSSGSERIVVPAREQGRTTTVPARIDSGADSGVDRVVPAQPANGHGRVVVPVQPPVQPVDGHDRVVVPSRPANHRGRTVDPIEPSRGKPPLIRQSEDAAQDSSETAGKSGGNAVGDDPSLRTRSTTSAGSGQPGMVTPPPPVLERQPRPGPAQRPPEGIRPRVTPSAVAPPQQTGARAIKPTVQSGKTDKKKNPAANTTRTR